MYKGRVLMHSTHLNTIRTDFQFLAMNMKMHVLISTLAI